MIVRNRRPRRVALAALGAVVAVVVAGAGVSDAAVHRVSRAAPRGTAASAGSDTKVVDYRGLEFGVPTSWPVYDLAADPTRCVRFDVHAVYLGSPSPEQRCPAHLVGRTETVLVEPADATGVPRSFAAAAPRVINGLPVEVAASDTAHDLVAAVPSAGVAATLTYPQRDTSAQSILQSFTSSRPLTGVQRSWSRHRAPSVAAPGVLLADRRAVVSSTAAKDTNPPQGFDACAAPSSGTLSAWWSGSPYTSVGVYLGGALRACAQPNLTSSWVQTVEGQGWSLIPTWVGPQAPCGGFSTKIPSDPAGAAGQGVTEADAAVAAAGALGLGAGTPIYYDMEAYPSGGACTVAVQDFTNAWSGELHAKGYLAGFYSSLCSGIQDEAAVSASSSNPLDGVWIADWNDTPNIYGFTSPCPLSDSVWAGRRLHQFRGGHDETWAASTINVDSDAIDGPVAAPSAPPPPPPPPGPGGPKSVRVSGFDAIATAIAVSQAEFPTTGSAGAVVLSRSDFFSDALAGGPLAAHVSGPLLITPGASSSASLDPRVLDEIRRVLPKGKTVYLLGGPVALDPSIDAALTGAGYLPKRLQGANEFATAVAIANELGNPSTIFEATGLDFPDALSAVPAAIHTGGAILLTNGTTPTPETSDYLARHPPTTRYVIGGPSAAYQDPLATAVFGADLFATSAKVASMFLAHAAVFGAATGLNYPDALAGGVFMATGGRLGPVLLVNPNAPLPAPIVAYLNSLAVGTQGYVFGGHLAVGDDVLAALDAAIG